MHVLIRCSESETGCSTLCALFNSRPGVKLVLCMTHRTNDPSVYAAVIHARSVNVDGTHLSTVKVLRTDCSLTVCRHPSTSIVRQMSIIRQLWATTAALESINGCQLSRGRDWSLQIQSLVEFLISSGPLCPPYRQLSDGLVMTTTTTTTTRCWT